MIGGIDTNGGQGFPGAGSSIIPGYERRRAVRNQAGVIRQCYSDVPTEGSTAGLDIKIQSTNLEIGRSSAGLPVWVMVI